MVPENVRIKFTKTGKLQFISHLDLCRTMRSALIRAQIPIWYSEGFNPHPKMVFALPLSVGAESICEYMDIKLDGEMDFEEIRSRLDAQTTEEMKITEAYAPERKFNMVAWAEYELTFGSDISAAAGIFSAPYVVMKRSKSGEHETDITPFIARYDINGDKAELLLSASGESYLNPDYAAAAISSVTGNEDYSIMRRNIYLEDKITPFR